MLADPYFALPAPKSTGREYFNIARLERQLAGLPAMAPVDAGHAHELTAVSISEQVLLAGGCERLLVRRRAQRAADGAPVCAAGDGGRADRRFRRRGDDMEALAFARLAFRTRPAVQPAFGDRRQP